jgi:hypothetical protein
MDNMPLNVADPIAEILLVPARLRSSVLDNQDTREIDRGHLAPLLWRTWRPSSKAAASHRPNEAVAKGKIIG